MSCYRGWQLQVTFLNNASVTVSTCKIYKQHWELQVTCSKKLPVTVSACKSSSATMCEMYHNTIGGRNLEAIWNQRGVSEIKNLILITLADVGKRGGGGVENVTLVLHTIKNFFANFGEMMLILLKVVTGRFERCTAGLLSIILKNKTRCKKNYTIIFWSSFWKHLFFPGIRSPLEFTWNFKQIKLIRVEIWRLISVVFLFKLF